MSAITITNCQGVNTLVKKQCRINPVERWVVRLFGRFFLARSLTTGWCPNKAYGLAMSLMLFLMGCETAVSSSTNQSPPVPTPTATIQYQIQQTLTIVNHGPGQPEKHNIWLALIGSVRPYQEVTATTITPDNYQLVSDEYGNQYAEFDLVDMLPDAEITITIQYDIAVHEIAYDLSDCQGELPDFYTQPELHIESNNPQIVALAEQLAEGQETACAKIEAFYNYIGNTLVYSYNGNNWGAQAALGPMGADCTEFASLMIALSRAAGIPARYLEGLHYFPEESEAIARTEHAWLEVYLPGIGWTPLDPTLGRSSLNRERYFARNTPGHIIVTQGRTPSTLRGSSYWSHLFWPGGAADIRVEDAVWQIIPVE